MKFRPPNLGFAPYLHTVVTVSVGATVHLDVLLPSASVTAQLTVSAQPPPIDPSQTSFSSAVDKEHIEELPVQGRNRRLEENAEQQLAHLGQLCRFVGRTQASGRARTARPTVMHVEVRQLSDRRECCNSQSDGPPKPPTPEAGGHPFNKKDSTCRRSYRLFSLVDSIKADGK